MQKQIIPAALTLILALSAGSSYATPPPGAVGDCPRSFEFQQVGGLPVLERADHNGDGWVCMKKPRDRPVVIDNRLPL